VQGAEKFEEKWVAFFRAKLRKNKYLERSAVRSKAEAL
jgi:hypothetical protein